MVAKFTAKKKIVFFSFLKPFHARFASKLAKSAYMSKTVFAKIQFG